jgi:DNA-binding transcriptional ArsR family regulator
VLLAWALIYILIAHLVRSVKVTNEGRGTLSGIGEVKPIEKGWVRERILSALVVEPSTVTELSKTIGVAKSTASYHLSLLLLKGVVELESKGNKGGAHMKLYRLREGSQVTVLTQRDEETELNRLKEVFELTTIPWRTSAELIGLEQVQSLLYKLFLHLFKISRTEHRVIMLEYGNRVGELLFRRLPGQSLRGALSSLTTKLASARLSDSTLLDTPVSPVLVVVSNSCIGSNFHPTNSCYFLEGIIERAVKGRFGPSMSVERMNFAGLSGCVIAVGRNKRIEPDLIEDSVMTSVRTINSGKVRGGGGK